MKSSVEYRYATLKDLIEYYHDDPMYNTARAIVIVKDGEVVGVGGVCRVDKQLVVFTDMREGKVTKRDVVMASRLLMGIINRYSSVIAFADAEKSTAKGFAAHYGFYPTGVATEEGEVLMKVTEKWTR